MINIFLDNYCQLIYTAKLLFHQSPTRHSDYTVTTTVTMYSLFSSPWHCDNCSVTIHQTHTLFRYPLPWAVTYVEISDYTSHTHYLGIHCHGPDVRRNLSRHLQATVTIWEDTRYTLLCEGIKVAEIQFCSLPLVPLVGERIVTTYTLFSHSTVTTVTT